MGQQSEPSGSLGREKGGRRQVASRPFSLPSPPLGLLPSPNLFLLFHPVFLPFPPLRSWSQTILTAMCLVQSAKDGTNLPLMSNSAEILVEYDLRMRNDWPVKKAIVDFPIRLTTNSIFFPIIR